ncbi:DUF4469 domain-containing protein [Candidatus Electronema sp. PJ]|uniref:DUF4469 domain-containing protein n=1 Tax=Candidatus Electronema sp. PJ TaxID=3401572 RepID=UPI003AA8B352
MSIQYKVEENQLTTPPSYTVRFVPRGSAGRAEIAADIALRHPNFSKADILTILNAEDEAFMARLLDGEQVTKEGCCTWFPSFAGRLDNPDDPLPPLKDCLHLNVRVSAPFVEDFCQKAQTDRLAATEKAPVITAAEDTVLGLRDVLRSDGMLRITGSNLAFDRNDPASRCLIEGTRSGSAVQSRIGMATNSEIILMPDVPSQLDPWNNEYRLSVTTRYTEHGSPRTGIYKHLLRTPLVIATLEPGQETGILTGADDTAYVTVTGGTASGEATLRIQVILDLQADCLRFNLLDMTEGGLAGAAITVTTNGDITLPGFAGSPVTTLDIRVLEYAALKDMLRNTYNCRLVDVLVVQ